MAAIRFNNSFSFAGGFNITNNEPIDSRMYVADIEHIYLAENWVKVKPYPGLIVASPNGEVRVCINSDYTKTSSWKKIEGNGNPLLIVESEIELNEIKTKEENIGKIIYSKIGEKKCLYILTAVNELFQIVELINNEITFDSGEY